MRRTHFTEVVLAHKDRIYTQAYYFLGNRPDAEDVTQEVLLRAWQNFEQIRRPTLGAWLMRVTHNVCIDTLRRHKSRRAAAENRALAEEAERLFAGSAENDPQRAVERRELLDQLQEAIQRLPARLRSIILMRELMDMRYEEISMALGIPLNSVKVYIHRGRKLLRAALGEMTEELEG
ncbi:MAG: RNA polymerase sigma factor [Candidatus Oleimicrobiaceae bacterium]